MCLRFMAGAMEMPFLPTVSSLGTDLVNVWGFSEEERMQNSKIPDKKLVVMNNPFGGWMETPKLVLVPAIRTDVTILHVQKADRCGTGRIQGLTFADVEQAKSSEHVIRIRLDLLQLRLPTVEGDEFRVIIHPVNEFFEIVTVETIVLGILSVIQQARGIVVVITVTGRRIGTVRHGNHGVDMDEGDIVLIGVHPQNRRVDKFFAGQSQQLIRLIGEKIREVQNGVYD
jgi:hypothetical protein